MTASAPALASPVPPNAVTASYRPQLPPGKAIHLTLKMNVPVEVIRPALGPNATAEARIVAVRYLRDNAASTALEWFNQVIDNGDLPDA